MIKFLRLSCCLATFFLVFNTSIQLEAQSFSASVQPYKSESLAKHFKTYQVFQLDAQALDAYVSSNSETKAQLKIGSHNWHLALTPNHIFSDNYSLQVSTVYRLSYLEQASPIPSVPHTWQVGKALT